MASESEKKEEQAAEISCYKKSKHKTNEDTLISYLQECSRET